MGKPNVKIILFFILMLFSFLLGYPSELDHIELVSIDFPNILFIHGTEKDFIENFNFTIFFRYFGKEISSISNIMSKTPLSQKVYFFSGSYSYMADYSVEGKIIFFDKNGNSLPYILDCYKKNDSVFFEEAEFSYGIYHINIFFKNNGIYSKDFRFFLSHKIKEKELLYLISKKRISKIAVYIKKMTIMWKLSTDDYKNNKEINKEALHLKINRTFEMDVIYGGKECYRGSIQSLLKFAINVMVIKINENSNPPLKYISDFFKWK